MGDYLIQLGNNALARRGLKAIGVSTPKPLQRAGGGYEEKPLQGRSVLLVGTGEGFLKQALQEALTAAGATLIDGSDKVSGKLHGIAFDATGVKAPADLKALYDEFHAMVRQLGENSRVVVATGIPEQAATSSQAACWRGVEGFVRSLAKEIGKRGATANLLYVGQDSADRIAGPLRFFMTPHSAYVDGQAVRITSTAAATANPPLTQALTGKTALVTGAARGIGAATANRLAAEGAHVICVDIPAASEALEQTAAAVGGTALALDVTADHTPARLVEFLKQRGGVDVVVHNAGITRDKTIANMPEHFWQQVIAINLEAILRIDERLQQDGMLREHGRIVCLSSIGGIAGNVGQTNYGATKAALIGYVKAEAPRLAGRGITINAVAPGFIETQMTAAMPFVIREGGRRMNSLSQGGQPTDVAELITFLSTPAAAGVSGQCIRVCGQSLIGA